MKHIIISPRILHLCLQLSSVGFFFSFFKLEEHSFMFSKVDLVL